MEGGEGPLRGDLVRKPKPAPPESPLKGTLLEPRKPDGGTKLTGSLVAPRTEGLPERFIHRDSGDPFTIAGRNTKKGLITLRGPDGRTVTLNEVGLQEKLATDGGPWRREEPK